uniref:NADH-ubiquinone oxidoreductase chain 3 n=1 Tax=Xenos vesparum TaxID=31928 RepID=Q0QJ93_9NEOP|nr:NADH dehydrogenase subunit 3 [Xenos vesparum]
MKVIIYSLMNFLIISLIMIFMNFFKYTMKQDKMSPFECGFNPNSKPRMPFSFHFFLISCLFLIFDSEITLVIPCILTLSSSSNFLIISLLLTILILFTSIIYEWKKKYLNWLL